MKNDWDAVVVNVGTPGSGKTVFSIQLAQMICEHLGIEFDLASMITYDGAGFLELLDINDDQFNIPPAEFETELSLPSGDFQKIIRDMVNIGENIEIKRLSD